MESFSLDHLPAELRNVHVGLFQNVKNAQELKTNLVAAAVNPDAHDERERLDFSFIEAKTVISRRHLLTAVHQACLAAARDALSTKTVHSEVLYLLNPSNNITDSLRVFGVSAKTTSLLLVQITPPADPTTGQFSLAWVEQRMRDVVEGDLVSLDTLGEGCVDWALVEKMYKLPKNSANRTWVEEVVISSVAMKSVS